MVSSQLSWLSGVCGVGQYLILLKEEICGDIQNWWGVWFEMDHRAWYKYISIFYGEALSLLLVLLQVFSSNSSKLEL